MSLIVIVQVANVNKIVRKINNKFLSLILVFIVVSFLLHLYDEDYHYEIEGNPFMFFYFFSITPPLHLINFFCKTNEIVMMP